MIKKRKEEKKRAKQFGASEEKRKKELAEKFNIVDQKYHLSSMSKDEYDKFVDKMYDVLEVDIKKALKPLNSKDIINKLKESYIADIRKWDADYPERLESDISEANETFKPGLFKIVVYDPCDYVQIVDGSQDICIHCSQIVYDVAEAILAKYSDFADAGLFGVGTGDGDEGCIYPEFVSYETMRKRI